MARRERGKGRAQATARRARPGEFGLIERYFAPLAADPGALGLLDDAALLSLPAREQLVVTTDTVVETVHFFSDDPPASIARKALRVNLSDLAAKGAAPMGYLLSLALPADWSTAWLASFAGALKRDQATYGVALYGGDTVRSPTGTTISITAFGRVPKGRAVLRSGARPGDRVYVTGTIGDAALGLAARIGRIDVAAAGRGAGRLADRFLHPQPRVALAPVLRRRATAALDVSDGLWADLGHMCAASGVTATVDGGRVPLSAPAARLVAADSACLAIAVTGGDDYEIVAAVPSRSSGAFEREAAAVGVPVTHIGDIAAGSRPPTFLTPDGRPMPDIASGHTHF